MATPAIVNPADILWFKGYLYGTISGGSVDTVLIAELQSVKLSWGQEFVHLDGPDRLTHIATGIKAKTMTFEAEYAKIRARQFVMALGATAAYSSPKTTLSLGIATEPALFNLHLVSNGAAGANGATIITAITDKVVEINLLNCICDSMDFPGSLNDFVKSSFRGTVLGDGTNLFQMLFAGDQTTS